MEGWEEGIVREFGIDGAHTALFKTNNVILQVYKRKKIGSKKEMSNQIGSSYKVLGWEWACERKHMAKESR